MDAKNLLDQHFETAFSAPDGIKRLRELILTLAMRGQLIPQDPADQPARELLREIEAEKQELIKAGKLKKSKPLPSIKLEEIPYELPQSWEWVRLGDCIIFTNGFAFKSNLFQNQGIGVVKIGDIVDGEVVTTKMSFIDSSILTEIDPKFQVHYEDLLIAMSGATTGKLGFNKSKDVFLLNQRVGKISPISINKYFLYNFLSTQIQKNLSISSGSAIPNLSTEQIENTIIPIPPLAEQKRLVEKIDRLMEQCDQLEQLGAVREQKRVLIHTSAREKLLKASDQETFGQAWDFIQENFGELYAIKENVTSLRQAILQLAVMGKLVPQDPNDPPASELLKNLYQARLKLYENQYNNNSEVKTMLKKIEKLGNVIPPFRIPKTWITIHLIECCEFLVDCHNKTAKYTYSGIPIIRTTNIKNRQIHYEEMKYVNKETYDFWSRRCPPKPKDIIFTREAPMGEAAIIPENAQFCLGQRTMLIRAMHKFINNKYLLIALTEPHLLERAASFAIGSTVKHLRVGDVEKLNIPLPPLPEQRRIVAKVDTLTALCDRLENEIDRQTAKQTQLLDAVMARI